MISCVSGNYDTKPLRAFFVTPILYLASAVKKIMNVPLWPGYLRSYRHCRFVFGDFKVPDWNYCYIFLIYYFLFTLPYVRVNED